MIIHHETFPETSRFKRFLRKILGAQDIVAVVIIHTGSGVQKTFWLTGADIRNPIDINGISES